MINHPHRSKRKVATGPTSGPRPAPRARRHVDHGYDGLVDGVQRRFAAIVETGSPLFLTDAVDLNEVYLDELPSQRQFHDCSACRAFLRRYGALARVNMSGQLEPAMWDPEQAPEFYRPAVATLADKVRKAKVTSVFLTKEQTWGTTRTGEWAHFAVTPPPRLIYCPGALTPGQAMAAARENVKAVLNAMAEYTPAILDEALRVLESGHLARSEKFVGPVRWLRNLHDWPKGLAKTKVRYHMLWRAVATAPEGYCHIRSSVVAPLLADIVAGVPFADLQRRHAAKVEPTRYQRPQAAPAAGNIAAAEKLIEKLGLARSLERRFARLDEVEVAWMPKGAAIDPAAGSVFGHIRPKDGAPMSPAVAIPPTTSTWEKFAREVLPRAERLELMVPSHGRFVALTTAAHADAPPILKWDREGRRNQVAWYVYPNGSPASQWGLRATAWAEVSAVTPFPNLWGDRPMPFLSEGVVIVIKGAMDSRRDSGNALFPECLRDDLHGARATLEAYSKSAELSGRDDGSACGYDLRRGTAGQAACTLRAFAGDRWSVHQIDRWD